MLIAHKKVSCAYRESRDFTFLESLYLAICSLIFHSKTSDNAHFFLGLVAADAVVVTPRAPGGQRACPGFSAPVQQLRGAEVAVSRPCNGHAHPASVAQGDPLGLELTL